MKKKQFYLVLNKKNKYTMGAFPRSKEGRQAALLYKESLRKKNKGLLFIIK
jgi:hypothetical protein